MPQGYADLFKWITNRRSGLPAYVVADMVSQEATVVITIRKAGKSAGYADTAGLSCEYAASVLAEEGLFTGRCVCGQYLFEPEETVSCGEFLSLCMETAGIEPAETTVSAESSATAAPVWIQQYVDAAVSEGCPVPTFGGAPFDADAPVTLGAAAQTLSKALRITPLSSASGEESAAARAIQELVACGLLPVGMDAEASLTRGQAAELFLKALDLLEQRG